MLRNPHHAPKTARGPRCPQGLKGRFQQSCVRKHVAPVHDRENMRALKSALQALRTRVFGGAPDPGLRRGLPEIGPSGLNCKRGQAEPTKRGPEARTTLRKPHHAPKTAPRPENRTWPPMAARGLKGRFQQCRVRKHVAARA